MDAIDLVIGLANPGKEYTATRHNAGAWWIESLLQTLNESMNFEAKFFGKIANLTIQSHKLKAFIPTTYMNESGKAVAKVSNFYKVNPKNILIVHDDLDLTPGKIKLKVGGGHGGHNGLRNIISTLGTKDFKRLRIGIGHPGNKNQVTSYVTKQPSKDDKEKILHAINVSIDFNADILLGNWDKAMNQLHNFNLD